MATPDGTDWFSTRMGLTIRRLFDAIGGTIGGDKQQLGAVRPDVHLDFSSVCLEKHTRAGAILIGIPLGAQEMPPAQQPALPQHRVARDLLPRLPVKIWGRNGVEAEELLHSFLASITTANSDDEDLDGTGYLRSEIGVDSIGKWESGTGQSGVFIPLIIRLRVPVYDDDNRRAPIDSASLGAEVVKPDGTTEPL